MDSTRQHRTERRSAHLKAGWILLVVAVLAIGATILATAARPHVVWLFSTSYGAVMMVVGVTLIRMGHDARAARGEGGASRLEGCST